MFGYPPTNLKVRFAGQRSAEEKSADWFERYRSHHGDRGWRVQMGNDLGVSDSNVRNWVKAGKIPDWALRTLDVLEERQELRKTVETQESRLSALTRDWSVIQDGDSISVVDTTDAHGRTIAENIVDLETAKSIAAIPKVKDLLEYVGLFFRSEEYMVIMEEEGDEILARIESAWEPGEQGNSLFKTNLFNIFLSRLTEEQKQEVLESLRLTENPTASSQDDNPGESQE